MKTGLKTALFLIVFALIVVASVPAMAQCSQCAAQVANGSKDGNMAANGLNKGIVFLLGAPYLAVAVIGFIWYKKFRRKNVNLDIKKEKLHLN